MIRSPLGLRLNPSRPIREQIREAATLGAKGVVLDAIGDLAPERLSETGRRDLRQLIRSVELSLVAVSLPTRRPFDTTDQLEDRLRRAEGAFTMAFELGARLVLARMGELPPETETDAPRREIWISALRELSRRADHRGVRFTLETGTEPGSALRPILDGLDTIGVAASIDPASLLVRGFDPMETTRNLGPWVAHAYLNDAATAGSPVVVTRGRGMGFPPSALDWEEYLGSLEEINYRDFLTIWPDPTSSPGPRFLAIAERLKRL